MLLVGVLRGERAAAEAARELLEKDYGPCRFFGPAIPFVFTDYYRREMGEGLRRDFLLFDRLCNPSLLASIKIRSNEIEELLAKGGRRKVNLDPGFLSLGKLILASTKDNAQRIPLRDGIYGEVTLIYRQGSYRPLPWTFPDYQSPEYLDRLKEMRKIFKERLRYEKQGEP